MAFRFFSILFLLTPLFSNAVTSEDSCDFVMELMWIQDLSISYEDDKPKLESSIPQIFKSLEDSFPGSSYGFSTFTDKPLQPFGAPPMDAISFNGDWCLNVSNVIGSTVEDISASLTSAQLGSGNDWPENQLGALLDIISNSTLSGFSEDTYNKEGRPLLRVVVLASDAPFHSAGDGASLGLFPNDADGHTNCEKEDYPSVDQVKNALKARGEDTYLIFMVGNDTHYSNTDVVTSYRQLLLDLDMPGTVTQIDVDSSSLVEAMEKAFEEMKEKICHYPSVDFVLIQDVTGSFGNDVEWLLPEMKNFTQSLVDSFDSPRFGLASFADKPVEPFGSKSSGDFCFRQDMQLTTDLESVIEQITALKTFNGKDWEEAQLHAIVSSARNFKWRHDGYVSRWLVVATDAAYHVKGDAHFLVATEKNQDECLRTDYPSIASVAQALDDADAFLVIATTPDLAPVYWSLLNQIRNFRQNPRRGGSVVIGDVDGGFMPAMEDLRKFMISESSVNSKFR